MSGAKNCPETPRQKMIGMMYLVLTAMLALNVSTDILNGFSMVDDSLFSSIQAVQDRNNDLYNSLGAQAQDNPDKFAASYAQAQDLRQHSDSLFNYIANFKRALAILADDEKSVNAHHYATGFAVKGIENKDNRDITGQYAIVQGNGSILKSEIHAYRDYLLSILEQNDNPMAQGKIRKMSEQINSLFACGKGWNAHDKDSVDWEVAIFEDQVVSASLTVLSKIQNDVRSTEGDMVSYLMGNADAKDLRVNKLQAYVIPKSDYVIRGGKYSAQIILAAIDSTQRPQYFIDGQRINDHGLYEVVAAGLGVKTYKGQIAFEGNTGEMQYLPFESSYTVGEPAVTISNTDLNIMYRGYENQFAISVPGIANEKVKVSVNGAAVSRRGNFWIIKPGDNSKEVTISVQAEMEGKMQSMGAQTYRVRALPKPGAYFKTGDLEISEGNISRAALLNPNASIIASYGPDGLLDLPFTITSFKVNVNGVLMESRTNKFTSQQTTQLQKLKKGAIVVITDIHAKGPDGKDTRLSPVILTMN